MYKALRCYENRKKKTETEYNLSLQYKCYVEPTLAALSFGKTLSRILSTTSENFHSKYYMERIYHGKKRKPSFLAKSKTNYLTLPSESLDFGWHTFRTIAVLVLICSSET